MGQVLLRVSMPSYRDITRCEGSLPPPPGGAPPADSKWQAAGQHCQACTLYTGGAGTGQQISCRPRPAGRRIQPGAAAPCPQSTQPLHYKYKNDRQMGLGPVRTTCMLSAVMGSSASLSTSRRCRVAPAPDAPMPCHWPLPRRVPPGAAAASEPPADMPASEVPAAARHGVHV